MQELGYESFYVQRPYKDDGCGIFWKADKCDCRDPDPILLVLISFLLLWIRLKCEKTSWVSFEDDSLRIGSMAIFSFKNPISDRKEDNQFLVGTTHLYWDHRHENYQANEMRIFLDAILKFNIDNLPIIITGDMNSSPGSAVHSLMLTGDAAKYPYRFKHVYRNYLNRGREPDYSSFKSADSNFWIDYVWYWTPRQETAPWLTRQVLAIPSVSALAKEGHGLPDSRFPSDHLPVGGAIAMF
jgi:mRNA deadenylase 3'-5' endonuclease subunit Ccr4